MEAELLERFYSSGPRLTAPLDGGSIDLVDSEGASLTFEVQEVAWKHLRNELLDQLASQCEAISADIHSLATLHRTTPSSVPSLEYVRKPFDLQEPSPPELENYHWLWKVLPWHRRKVDAANDAGVEAYQAVHRGWLDARSAHDRKALERQSYFRKRDSGDSAGIEDFLGWHLTGLQWPQDTSVDLALSPEGSRLCLDVDFPEIEDLPHGVPEVAVRARELRVKPFSESAKRKLYAAHVHAVMFRLVGEAFHAAPTLGEVVASGYSQRPDKATGTIRDEYLISVVVERSGWQEIDFSRLDLVDPVDALARFPLRRKMTKTGIFSAIEPYT
ncbi:hypothetical protein [Marilutibacter alkalisoli]|uniref:hypothetical protein n=1 Tax=Marilutibacter alkalisoli TaxID=2591633 RepID=UPI001FCA3CE2|nr:hypothetical protein [Lysobacter alkalisoli]